MRLGLVIAEIGEKNNIKVTDEELSRAVMERARQFPGQEQQVWDFYRNNPQALASLARADLRGKGRRLPGRTRQGHRKKVSREELYKEDDDDGSPDARCGLRNRVMSESRSACKRCLARLSLNRRIDCAIQGDEMKDPRRYLHELWCPWWSSRPTAASGPTTSSRGS